MNYEAISYYETQSMHDQIGPRLVPAVQGFFQSIALDRQAVGGTKLQDLLRLLNLWFKNGHVEGMSKALKIGFNTIPVDTWLQVIPQVIARIHTNQTKVRNLIHELLTKVGHQHPQALIYPLTVARSVLIH